MRRKTTFLFIALSAIVLYGQQVQAIADSWKPDPAILPKLGPITILGSYAMRFPVGYGPVNPTPAIASTQPKAEVAAVYASSDKHPTGGAAALGIAIVTISKNVNSAAMITEGLHEALQHIVRDRRRAALTWTNGNEERGSINGLSFARLHFSETVGNPAGTRAIRGFIYVSVYGHTFASFQGFDDASYSSRTLPEMEAAVLTFHKQ